MDLPITTKSITLPLLPLISFAISIVPLFLINHTQAQTLPSNNTAANINRHVLSLNELTARRRTNPLFYNEQSPKQGQRMGHVNVDEGNTTFVLRDLVVVNRLPLLFSRVYDSSVSEHGDFASDKSQQTHVIRVENDIHP